MTNPAPAVQGEESVLQSNGYPVSLGTSVPAHDEKQVAVGVRKHASPSATPGETMSGDSSLREDLAVLRGIGCAYYGINGKRYLLTPILDYIDRILVRFYAAEEEAKREAKAKMKFFEEGMDLAARLKAAEEKTQALDGNLRSMDQTNAALLKKDLLSCIEVVESEIVDVEVILHP